MPCTWIQHKGKDILISDFSALKKPEETIVMLAEVDAKFP
jgi:hypothetical protein